MVASLPKTGCLALVLLVVVAILHGGNGASDVDRHMFTSYANLLKLYYMEEESLSNVDVFLREELLQHQDEAGVDAAHNMTSVRKLTEEAKETHKKVGAKVKEYLSHPVNVFHLTLRLFYGWKEAIDLIRNSKACREWHMPQLVARLSNIEENLPTKDDLVSVAYNLLTIQHTQGIRTGDIIRGRVGSHPSLVPVSLQDQFRVAKLAVDEDDYYYAAQWLKHLSKSPKLKNMKREEDGFNATNVFGMLASAYFRINMIPEALRATDDLLKKDPENMVARTNKVFFEERIARNKDLVKEGKPTRYGKDDSYRRNYETLCRGTHIKLSRHRCRLEPTWPGSKISFHKMEILRRKPPIVAFHDVISRQDAAKIADISDREYEKAAMDSDDGFKTPEFTLVLSRVDPGASLPAWRSKKGRDKYMALLASINNKLQDLPRMASKPFATGESEARNFGHQGFYLKPSPDFHIQSMGGHTATAMLFLNDVEMGGEIVFPSANTRVSPQVGTVVYYFPSFNKFHTVCPVAYGTEWVLVHSFYEKQATDRCRPHEDPDML